MVVVNMQIAAQPESLDGSGAGALEAGADGECPVDDDGAGRIGAGAGSPPSGEAAVGFRRGDQRQRRRCVEGRLAVGRAFDCMRDRFDATAAAAVAQNLQRTRGGCRMWVLRRFGAAAAGAEHDAERTYRGDAHKLEFTHVEGRVQCDKADHGIESA